MKNIYIDALHQEETRVVVMDQNNRVSDFDIETSTKPQIKGNIYLAKIIRIEPSLQAAFVDYGSGKNSFLPFSEIHPDNYQIDADKKKHLLELAHANFVDDDADPDDEADMVEYDDESAGEDNKEITKRSREYKIQDVLKPNQIILVQGVKEERGNKGAAMTTFLSLAGRFAVLMPNSRKRNGYGISKKIGDKDERARLRDILHKLKIPKGMTFVLRTAAFGATADEIEKDYDFLSEEWNEIRKRVMESTAPSTIHYEDSLLKRVVRDFITDEADVLTIQGSEAYELALEYFRQLRGKKPNKKQIVAYESAAQSLFSKVGIERQLEGLHGPKVNLPSGGELVINQTEAMVTIDVNSSKAIKEKDIERTAIQTNMEAAEEIGLQLKLRDLAGIVAIDFIDMEDERNNHKLEQKMRDIMKRDRARTQVAKINGFGVMMLSRQRMRSSFLESSYVQCPHCQGAGLVPSIQTAAIIMFRHLQDKISVKSAQKLVMTVPSDVALYLLNQKRTEISALENEYGTEIAIIGDDSMLNLADYTIQRATKEPSTDEQLNAHKPSTDIKKESEIHKDAKKLVGDTRNRRFRNRNRNNKNRRQSKDQKPSLWKKVKKIIG